MDASIPATKIARQKGISYCVKIKIAHSYCTGL